MNRWLGRAPRSRDELRRLQVCCDSLVQCSACPLRSENAARNLRDLARAVLAETGRRP
jgi:hypothetical protein